MHIIFPLVGLRVKNLKKEMSSFNTYLPNTFHMLCTVLGTGNIIGN